MQPHRVGLVQVRGNLFVSGKVLVSHSMEVPNLQRAQPNCAISSFRDAASHEILDLGPKRKTAWDVGFTT